MAHEKNGCTPSTNVPMHRRGIRTIKYKNFLSKQDCEVLFPESSTFSTLTLDCALFHEIYIGSLSIHRFLCIWLHPFDLLPILNHNTIFDMVDLEKSKQGELFDYDLTCTLPSFPLIYSIDFDSVTKKIK